MTAARTRQRFLVTGVAVLVLFILLLLGRGAIERALAVIQRPVVRLGTWISLHSAGLLSSEESLRQKIQRLEEQRVAWALDQVEGQRLNNEHTQLLEQLEYVQRHHFQTVTAAIIARALGSRQSTFLIDRGSEDNVTIGAPVMTGAGLFLGKISAMSPRTSTVTLLTDPTMTTAASLVNETRTIGVTQGLNGSLMTIKFIPHDQPLEVNNLVTTSGLEEQVPSGLVLGVVNAVRSEKNEPFQEAIVEPLTDIRHVDLVTIIIGQGL